MLPYEFRLEVSLIQTRDFRSRLLKIMVRLYRAMVLATPRYCHYHPHMYNVVSLVPDISGRQKKY